MNKTPRSSPSEERFKQAAIEHGYQVLERGMPDFVLYREDGSGGLRFVEVKAGLDILRPDQIRTLRVLAKYFDTKIALDGDFDNLLTIDEFIAVNRERGKRYRRMTYAEREAMRRSWK